MGTGKILDLYGIRGMSCTIIPERILIRALLMLEMNWGIQQQSFYRGHQAWNQFSRREYNVPNILLSTKK